MANLVGLSLVRYQILEPLGEGGMATVYRAYDTRLDCDVAIKFIRAEKFSIETSEKALKRFRIEANKMAQLTHPNIIGVTDYGEYNGSPYLVMKYLPGGTLKKKLGQPIPYQDAARMLVSVARALDYSHSQGIIHRDIKPANILLTSSGQPMLSDFGIAKILITDETLDLTTTGVGIGTPEYMAPEQAMGQTVDARADVYALGVVLYEMITGRKPFRADTPMAVIIKQVHDPLPLPREFVNNLPDTVERVIIKALAKKPEDRYQDMGAFAAALDNLAIEKISTHKIKILNKPSLKQKEKRNEVENRKAIHWKLIGAFIGVIGLISTLMILWLSGIIHGMSSTTGTIQALPALPTKVTESQDQMTATVTPEQTSPGEKLVYSEDFEDGFAQGFEFGQGNWSVVNDGSGNKVLEQSSFPTPTGSNFGPLTFINGIIEFRFRVTNINAQGFPVVLTIRHQQASGTQYIVSCHMSEGTGISYSENNGGWQSMGEGTSGSAKAFSYPRGEWVKDASGCRRKPAQGVFE